MNKLVIFDLDGTLLNSIDDLGNACNYALKKNGYNVHRIEAYKKFVGDGRYVLIERILPTNSRNEENIKKVLYDFDMYYNEHMLDYTQPYEGIESVIDTLKSKGIKLAVVSNKPHEYVQGIVKKYFEDKIDCVYGHRVGYNTKPDPVTINEVIEKFKIDKSETIFVGDSNVDIRTAQNAGVKSIGVLWGFRDEEELRSEGADYIVSDSDELLSTIVDRSK